jgi:hypothetical protein
MARALNRLNARQVATLLPKPEKLKQVKHFPAMPFADLPKFLKLLRARPGTDARALEFLILTALRTVWWWRLTGTRSGATPGRFPPSV